MHWHIKKQGSIVHLLSKAVNELCRRTTHLKKLVKRFITLHSVYQIKIFLSNLHTYIPKVPILKEVNFGKVKLWDVEHFWTLFVFTFGRDCYCIQQSRPKMKTKSVQKCSTRQSFTFSKWHSFKIGTLDNFIISET